MQDGIVEGGAVRNFLVGLMLGVLATYWYLTQMPYTRALVEDWWDRASQAPAPHAGPKAPAR